MATNAQPVGTQGAGEKRKRMRSPEHPFINLDTALKRARQFYDVAVRNAISINSAIKGWGYAEGSSGGLQTTAALISFGLLKDEGTGEKRKLQLTPLALHILLDVRPDSSDRAELIKRAALMPKIHKQLWDKWGAQRPSAIEIRHVLTVEWEPPFNEKSVDGFINEYEETIRFAKLNEAGPEEKHEENKETPAAYVTKVGDYVQWEQNGVLALPEPTRVRAITPDGKFALLEGSNTGVPITELIQEQPPAGAAVPASGHVPSSSPAAALPGSRMQKDIFSLKEGEVTLFWPSPLSEESEQDISDWLEIVKRKFARAVHPKEPAGA